MRFRFFFLCSATILATAALIQIGCSASSDSTTSLGGSGSGGGSVDGATSTFASAGIGGGDASIDIGPDSAPIDPDKYAALCGMGMCSPGASPNDCALMPALDGGSGGSSPATEVCELVIGANGAHPQCGPVGPSGADDPCTSAADCGAGLGCVQAANGGVCRPYCCGDVEACPDKTYCAPEPMAEDGMTPIPVCVPTDNCVLLPDDQTCPPMQTPPPPGCCASGLACFIVRGDGSTTCQTPGAGGVGDPCPCQAGFVCAKLTNECKKLCHIGSDAVDCPGGGKCEGGAMSYPANFGVCVAGNQKSY